MQLSSAAVLQAVTDLQAQGNFPAAYKAVLDDLTAHYPNPSAGDKDVLHWLDVAIQINSGATTLSAIGVRANNVAAMQYEKGVSITF